MRRTVCGENVRWRERKPPLRRWNMNLRRATTTLEDERAGR